jgi:hypothetical protein
MLKRLVLMASIVVLGGVWAEQVNPVDFVQDIVIDQGMRKKIITEEDKLRAFRQMMVEKVFLKDMFNSEQSIYKPEPEEGEGLVMSKGLSTIYSTYMRKQMAAHLAEQGILSEVTRNAVR